MPLDTSKKEVPIGTSRVTVQLRVFRSVLYGSKTCPCDLPEVTERQLLVAVSTPESVSHTSIGSSKLSVWPIGGSILSVLPVLDPTVTCQKAYLSWPSMTPESTIWRHVFLFLWALAMNLEVGQLAQCSFICMPIITAFQGCTQDLLGYPILGLLLYRDTEPVSGFWI